MGADAEPVAAALALGIQRRHPGITDRPPGQQHSSWHRLVVVRWHLLVARQPAPSQWSTAQRSRSSRRRRRRLHPRVGM
uniref:Uncharacterized protein n=1 Tax=Arundo donax TaxID=35708 RepID=A0A0A8YHX6_ARUDO